MRRIGSVLVALVSAAVFAAGCSSGNNGKFDTGTTGGSTSSGTTTSSSSSGSSGSSGSVGTCTDPGATLTVFTNPSPLAPSQAGSLVVLLSDSNGNPLSGCTVSFKEATGETMVTLAPRQVATAADGTATTTVTAGSTAGTAHVTASLGAATTTADIVIGGGDAGSVATGCGDLTGATLNEFELQPQSLDTFGGTNTSATFVVIGRYADGGVAAGCPITFGEAANEPSIVLVTPASTTVGADGSATATISSGSNSGLATVVATLGGASLSVSIPVGQTTSTDAGAPMAASISWTSTSTTNSSGSLGVQGTGNEQGSMTFTVIDQYGKPMPNVNVTFSVYGANLITFPAGSSAPTSSGGQANVLFSAGTHAGTTGVKATVDGAQTVSGNAISAVHTIAVHSGRPSASNFVFWCDRYNLPAYTTFQHDFSTTCHVALADHSGNPVDSEPSVSFFAEAGRFDPGTVVVDTTGHADVTYTTNIAQGYGPKNVDPLPANQDEYPLPALTAAEPSYAYGAITRNPRDQLVTLIAVTEGEEAFSDENSDGIFEPDSGETFVDMPDPYIDVNDDNTFDESRPGTGDFEPRFCSEQNLDAGPCPPDFQPGNSAWDSSATIWTAVHVVYTGAPALQPAPTSGSPVGSFGGCLNDGAAVSVNLFAYDDYRNIPGTDSTFSIATTAPGLAFTNGFIVPEDNFGTTDIDGRTGGYYEVAESDGGECKPDNGEACVLKFRVQGFRTGFVGPVTLANANSGAGTCQPFTATLTGTYNNASAVTTMNGTFQP